MDIIIVGAFSEVVELCELAGHTIVGIFDSEPKAIFDGYPILGNDISAIDKSKTFSKYPIIVSPDLPAKRKQIVKLYKDAGYRFFNLVSPNAMISKTSLIGIGNIIQHNVNLSANTQIGDFVKLNTNANIMHNVTISDYCSIAPNAVLLGHVTIDESSYIGANATVLPGVSIGSGAVVGAGSVVTKKIANNLVFAGNPARLLKK